MTSIDDRILAELHKWREDQIALGNFERGVVKDTTLNQILRSGAKTAQGLAQVLPASAKQSAESLADLINRTRRDQTAAATDTTGPQGAPGDRDGGPRTAALRATDGGKPADDQPALRNEDFSNNHVASAHGPSTRLWAEKTSAGYKFVWQTGDVGDDQVVIYRVVARDDYEPHRPDRGRPIAVTTSTEAHDDQPLRTAVRFVVVWRHRGDTVEEALQSSPELTARTQIIAPVVDFRVFADHGSVIGRWTALPKTTRVRVYRIPLRGIIDVGDERNRVFTAQQNLTGFTDTEAVPGVAYLYRAISEIDLGGGTVLSEAVEGEAVLSAELQSVTDLRVTPMHSGGRKWLDLEWTTPPAGDVHIYRTKAKPPESLGHSSRAEANLVSAAISADAQLTSDSRVQNPVALGEVSQMAQVAWPPGWVFVHLTPVTVHDGMVQVGKTVTVTMGADVMRFARVIERCHEQIITFAWPEGADEVRVHVAGDHLPVDAAIAQPATGVIDKHGYERDGGLHLPGPLPAAGCAIHLVPITFSGLRATLGEVTRIAYPGLRRVRYEVTTTQLKRGEKWLSIRLLPEVDLRDAPPFALVYNPERLPLSIGDGRAFDTYYYDQNPSSVSTNRIHSPELRRGDPYLLWRAPITGLDGYIRLFADAAREEGRTLAVIDPPLRGLVLTGSVRTR